jgi:hypothetical protein
MYPHLSAHRFSKVGKLAAKTVSKPTLLCSHCLFAAKIVLKSLLSLQRVRQAST